MMATLQEIGNAAGQADGVIFIRLVGAVITAAGDIRTEDPGTSNHDNRIKWADSVSRDVRSMSQAIFHRLLQNSNVQDAIGGSAVTDAQIQTAVDGVVDEFATGG